MWKYVGAICLSGTIVSSAIAENSDLPAWQSCFQEAGAHYRISPELLIAIARTESALDPSAIHLNPDGSLDIGLMQINSLWLPALQEIGIAPASLYQPCTSIWVGAWVMAQAVARHGYTWEAVGAYNAGHRRDIAADRRRAIYAHRVSRHLDRIGADQRVLVTSRQSATASPSSVESSASDSDLGLRER